MPGGFPNFGIIDNRRIQPDDILPPVDHSPPPSRFEVVLQLRSQRPKTPKSGKPAVEFGGRIDKTPPFAERNDFFKDVREHQGKDTSYWVLTTNSCFACFTKSEAGISFSKTSRR